MIKKTLFFIFPSIASGCKYLLKPRPLHSRLRQTKVYCGRRCIKTRKIFVFKSIIFNKKKLLPNKHFFLEIRDVEEDILAKEVNQTVNLIDPPKKPKTTLRNCFWGLFWKFPHHLSPMSDCFCCNIINFKMISKLS